MILSGCPSRRVAASSLLILCFKVYENLRRLAEDLLVALTVVRIFL